MTYDAACVTAMHIHISFVALVASRCSCSHSSPPPPSAHNAARNVTAAVERQWRQQLAAREHDEVEDGALRDFWMRHLHALYTDTRVYSPSGDWPQVVI
jgi:hypothetical protein